MKKSLFFLAVILVLGAIYLLVKKSPQETKAPDEVKVTEFTVVPVKDFKDPRYVPEREKEALKEQLHEGTAIFADLYRLEMAIKQEEKHCLYLLFIDNYLAEPLFPNGTELAVSIEGKSYNLTPVRNGLMANGGKCPTLPATVKISGKLRKKYFEATVAVRTYRKNTVDLRNVSR